MQYWWRYFQENIKRQSLVVFHVYCFVLNVSSQCNAPMQNVEISETALNTLGRIAIIVGVTLSIVKQLGKSFCKTSVHLGTGLKKVQTQGREMKECKKTT